MPVIYRIATLDDLEHLVELRILMQTEVNPALSPDQAYPGSVREYFRASITSGASLSIVAESEGMILGVGTTVYFDKPPSINGGSSRVGYISNVFTRVGHR